MDGHGKQETVAIPDSSPLIWQAWFERATRTPPAIYWTICLLRRLRTLRNRICLGLLLLELHKVDTCGRGTSTFLAPYLTLTVDSFPALQ